MDIFVPDWFGALARTVIALRSEAAAYPQATRIWMGIMATVFFAAVIFAPRKQEARVVLAAILGTIGLLLAAKFVRPDVARALAGATIHVILWPPLLVYLVFGRGGGMVRRVQAGNWFDGAFGIWVGMVVFVIAVSLVFDIRTVAIWFTR